MKNAVLFNLILFLIPGIFYAQEINWYTETHQLTDQDFKSMEYIYDPISPSLVTNFLTQNPNSSSQGSPYQEFYLKGFDTNGVEKWSFEIPRHGQIIPDNETGFWYYIAGADSINFNNQWYQSGYSSVQYGIKYFFHLNAEGEVINWFVRAEEEPLVLYFGKIKVDFDGNLCLSGSLSIDGSSNYYPFIFANYSDIVHTTQTHLLFAAKIDTNGNELAFFPINHTGNPGSGRSTLSGIEVNPITKEYSLLIRSGDTIYLPNDTLVNLNPYRLNTIMVLDSTFQYKTHADYHISDYTSLYESFKWSQGYSYFYIASNYGDTFYLDTNGPIPGHSGTVQNAMIVKFNTQTLGIEKTRTFRPNDSGYFSAMYITDWDMDSYDNVHFVGYIGDSTFTSEDTVLTYYNSAGVMGQKGFYMCLDSNLNIVYDIVPEDNVSLAYYRNVSTDPTNNSIYISGKYAGQLVISPYLDITSTSNWYDGLIICVKDTTTVSDTTVSDTTIADTLSGVHSLNMSAGFNIYPNPSDELINIEVDQNVNISSISVFDLKGSVINSSSIQLNSNKQTMNVSDWRNGIYILKISTDKETHIQQVIIQH